MKLLFGLPLVLSFVGCIELPSIIDSAPDDVYTVFHWTVTDRETQEVLGSDCESVEDSPCRFQFAAVPGQKVTVSVRFEDVRKNKRLSDGIDRRAYLCSTDDDRERHIPSFVTIRNQCTVVRGDDPPATLVQIAPSNRDVSGLLTKSDGYDMDLDILHAGVLNLTGSYSCDLTNPVVNPYDDRDFTELVIVEPGQSNCSPFHTLACGSLRICPDI